MKKSVVLQAPEGEEKAVLSLEDKEDMIVGRVRLYNFKEEPKGILSLGFSTNGKVVKAGLTRSSSMLYTFQTDVENLNENFSCAVVNSVQGELKALLFGSSEGRQENHEKIASALGVMDEDLSVDKVEKKLDELGIYYDQNYEKEIDEEIDNYLDQYEKGNDSFDRCANCKYKKCYVEKEDTKVLAFYNKLKSQIDRIFEENPEEEYLSKIIPSSKWVKVEYEKEGDYYVIGLIYENGALSYLCYGVPGVYQKNPPKELSGYPVWLPIDSEKRDGFGYWLVYQNADTGESIKAIID